MVVPGRARGDGGRRPGLGPRPRHPRDRQVPRREDRRPHGARSVAALSVLDLARALVDIDSTTGREARGLRAGWPSHLRERGFQVTEQPVSDGRTNILAVARPEARRRPLDPHRLRAALLPERGRGRPPLRPRRLRREGRPRRPGRRPRSGCATEGRSGWASSSWSARSAAATGPAAANAISTGPALPRERRAHREQAGARDARGLPGQAPGDRARRPLVAARARRSPRSTS